MTTATAPPRRTYLTVVRGLLRSARPKQTAKNGLVLVPVFFTINKWWDTNDIAGMLAIVGLGLAAFALFTLMSGVVYLVNDALDVESDRAHPVKRHRPIAAGIVPVPLAFAVAGVLGAVGIVAAFLMSYEMVYVTLAYLGLNVAYSLVLKRVVILDVAAISAGFVIRATAGSLAIDGSTLTRLGVETSLDLTISPWLYVVTALGALFIALAKRRSELAGAGDRSASTASHPLRLLVAVSRSTHRHRGHLHARGVHPVYIQRRHHRGERAAEQRHDSHRAVRRIRSVPVPLSRAPSQQR